jgi:hypothetical protein
MTWKHRLFALAVGLSVFAALALAAGADYYD